MQTIDWNARVVSNAIRGSVVSCEEDYMMSREDPSITCVDDVWLGTTCRRRIFRNPVSAYCCSSVVISLSCVSVCALNMCVYVCVCARAHARARASVCVCVFTEEEA